MAIIKDAAFSISVIGETTGEKWLGEFKALKFLSHRQQLLRDQRRRELLGSGLEGASERAKNQAEIFSQLAVRLSEAPNWWKESNGGLDLVDDNVVADIYYAALKVEADHIETLKKTAEAAKEGIKGELKKEEEAAE